MKPLFFLSLLSVWSALVIAQTPKTFYVGHSLSDQIPDMVQSLSNDHASVDFNWVYQSIPGAPLAWQWNRKNELDYTPIDPHYYGFYDETNGLPAGNFDILVLTEAVPRYPAIIEETYAYADSFYTYAIQYNPDIQVYLYEDWHCILSGTPTGCDYDVDSNPWRQRLADDLPMWESVVDTLNARFSPANPVCLIPAGQGLATLYDSIAVGSVPGITNIESLFADNIHLTDIGKYFIACIHFSMIHQTSPEGLTNQLQVWWGGDFEAPSPELALKFQQIAWQVANDYPRSCLNTTETITAKENWNITVAPNPFVNNVVIDSPWDNYKGEVYDCRGQLQYSFEGNSTSQTIQLSDLVSGVYFVQLQANQEEEVYTFKLVKE